LRVASEAISRDDTSERPFRGDIEGLRGIAIILVVAFHAGVAALPGGYVGVDVFYVISGFLISGLLLRGLETSGKVALGAFWARRIRRLAPALLLCVVVTLGVGLVLYSPLYWGDLAGQSAASAAYVSNVLFAVHADAYFLSAQSPLLHTWSLGVEEQFYVFWPLLFWVVARALARSRRNPRVGFAAALVLVGTVSFGLCVALTVRGTPWAFYSMPTRGWEFALGGLVAIWSQGRARLAPRVTAGLGWAGLGLVLLAGLWLTPLTPYPGVAATIPVVGTAMLIAFAAPAISSSPTSLLSLRSLRYVGRISYSWYLWHWPAIVFADVVTRSVSVTAHVVALAASFLLAVASYRWAEQPGRLLRPLARPSRVIALGVSGSLLVIGSSVAVARRAQEDIRTTPLLASLLSAREGRSETGSDSCSSQEVMPGHVECVYGDVSAETTVMLVGDSHAAMWSPALEAAADDLQVRLLVRTYGGCPAPDIFVARTGFADVSEACLAYRAQTRALIDELQPELVVIGSGDYVGRLLSAPGGKALSREEAIAAAARASGEFARWVEAQGSRVAVIRDNPTLPFDPIECLAEGDPAQTCSPERSEVVPPLEQATKPQYGSLRAAGVTSFFDPTPLICGATVCLVVRDGQPVYTDDNHLSLSFVRAQTARIADFMTQALSEQVSSPDGRTNTAP
jgi:peptidoglycan/LPS O-acetylase OafA/YrhL